MNSVDVVIAAFILFGAMKGYRNGLVIAVVGLSGYVLAVAVAWIYSPTLLAWVDGQGQMVDKIAGTLRDRLPFAEAAGQTTNAGGQGIVGMLPLPETYRDQIAQYLQHSWAQVPAGSGSPADAVYQQLALAMVHVLAFATVFLVALLAFRFLAIFFTRTIGRGRIIGRLNRIAGLCIGTGINALVICLVIGFFTPWLVVAAGSSSEGLLAGLSGLLTHSTLVPYCVNAFAWMTTAFLGLGS